MKQELIPVPGGRIAAHTVGQGKPLLFLHGGPGDTHHYMKRMAEPLLDRYQCVFFDQRGTGESTIYDRSQNNFAAELILSDALAVKNHFGLKSCVLVGHSWGAMYGLFLTICYPQFFQEAALISMGPLDEEMAAGYDRNFNASLSQEEHIQWKELYTFRNQARDSCDLMEVIRLDAELMKIRVKSWIYNAALREDFLVEYHLDPPPDRQVNKWIWEGFRNWFDWKMLENLNAKLWLCNGANDPTPVAQSNRILGSVHKTAELWVVEQCGHIPWIEYPQKFFESLNDFLN